MWSAVTLGISQAAITVPSIGPSCWVIHWIAARIDDLARLVDGSARKVHEAQRPERQRDAVAQLSVLDVDKFKRAAAQIPRHTIRTRNAGYDAEGRIVPPKEIDCAQAPLPGGENTTTITPSQAPVAPRDTGN